MADFFNRIGRQPTSANGCFGSRLCENVFGRRDRQERGRKPCLYVKSDSAKQPTIFRFCVEARTSVFDKRFHTAWVDFCR